MLWLVCLNCLKEKKNSKQKPRTVALSVLLLVFGALELRRSQLRWWPGTIAAKLSLIIWKQPRRSVGPAITRSLRGMFSSSAAIQVDQTCIKRRQSVNFTVPSCSWHCKPGRCSRSRSFKEKCGPSTWHFFKAIGKDEKWHQTKSCTSDLKCSLGQSKSPWRCTCVGPVHTLNPRLAKARLGKNAVMADRRRL